MSKKSIILLVVIILVVYLGYQYYKYYQCTKVAGQTCGYTFWGSPTINIAKPK